MIYASDQSKIWRTTNGGTTWTNVTSNLPTGTVSNNTDVAIDPRDPMRVFVSTSGYQAGKKAAHFLNPPPVALPGQTALKPGLCLTCLQTVLP